MQEIILVPQIRRDPQSCSTLLPLSRIPPADSAIPRAPVRLSATGTAVSSGDSRSPLDRHHAGSAHISPASSGRP